MKLHVQIRNVTHVIDMFWNVLKRKKYHLHNQIVCSSNLVLLGACNLAGWLGVATQCNPYLSCFNYCTIIGKGLTQHCFPYAFYCDSFYCVILWFWHVNNVSVINLILLFYRCLTMISRQPVRTKHALYFNQISYGLTTKFRKVTNQKYCLSH